VWEERTHEHRGFGTGLGGGGELEEGGIVLFQVVRGGVVVVDGYWEYDGDE
jgi:hypothetical protein